MILPQKTKHERVIIHVIEQPDSLIANIFAFLACLSFVTLLSLLAAIFYFKPANLETVSAPARELFQEMAIQAMSHFKKPVVVESLDLRVVPAPNIQPSYMTTDAVLKAPAIEQAQPLIVKTETVLADPLHRISPEFQIPDSLRKRVAFWFDIYTKYSSLVHVIHHDRFPWIIYRVVDTTPMMSTKGPEWLRRERGNIQAKRELGEITNALYKLSRRTSYENLSIVEADLVSKLAPLPGPRRKVFQLAYQSVRKQLGQRDFYISGLRNSAQYLPYMEEEMRSRGVPAELSRLPLVESSFNEKAESKVGASGVWQIMPKTGKAYLLVNDFIDERNAPLKATRVAAYIFKTYHHALKSWPLAVTSYNNGIGNIQVAIRHARSEDLATIIERNHTGDFKFASSNFFTCFLAALYAEKYQEVVFPTLAKPGLHEREAVVLNRRMNVDELIQMSNLSTEKFLQFNLDLKHAIAKHAVLPKGYELHLPVGSGQWLSGVSQGLVWQTQGTRATSKKSEST